VQTTLPALARSIGSRADGITSKADGGIFTNLPGTRYSTQKHHFNLAPVTEKEI
jgi:hypothetical protein